MQEEAKLSGQSYKNSSGLKNSQLTNKSIDPAHAVISKLKSYA